MARQDYTGGDRGQMERQQAAAEAASRPDVDYGGGDVFVGGAGSGGESQQEYNVRTDPRNQERYQNYLAATGRSLSNPYGNEGIFSNIFGQENVSYFDATNPQQLKQAREILDIGFRRYENFNRLPEQSRRVGFGSLFGSPEGEVTAQGEVRQQVTPMSAREMGGRALASALGLGLFSAMVPGGNIDYKSTGTAGYDPSLDPIANPDLQTGMLSNVANLLTGGAGTAVAERTGQGITTLTDRVRDFFTPENEQVIKGQINRDNQTVPVQRVESGVNRVQLPDGRTVLTQDGAVKSMNDPFSMMRRR